MSREDLSGRWTGMFSYPSDLQTGFVATISDRGGVLTGHVVEPRYDGRGAVEALIDGRREGERVMFAKAYDGRDDDYDMVSYVGRIQADGLEIAGRWTIHGVSSGNFIMVREAGVDEVVHVAEKEVVGR